MSEEKKNRILPAHRVVGDPGSQKGTRRRGEILEDAILLAAWEELSETGYTHLTMEGVAARAKTNKAVVYRRWPNKSRLVIAALKKYLPITKGEVPDTGNLRTDVLVLLRNVTQPLQAIGAETLHGLLADLLDKERISSLPRMLRSGGNEKVTVAMRKILEHAQKRGEVSLASINPRIISLPMDLIRYEILIRQEPVSDTTLNEIVDDIFLPLITAKR
jgi:AcrR family transcriptional regulator